MINEDLQGRGTYLTPRECYVIDRRLGFGETYIQIAKYMLLSDTRIRQIEAKALRKMRYGSSMPYPSKGYLCPGCRNISSCALYGPRVIDCWNNRGKPGSQFEEVA